jgi:hypothetical protein
MINNVSIDNIIIFLFYNIMTWFYKVDISKWVIKKIYITYISLLV